MSDLPEIDQPSCEFDDSQDEPLITARSRSKSNGPVQHSASLLVKAALVRLRFPSSDAEPTTQRAPGRPSGGREEAALGLPSDVHSFALISIGYPMGRFGPVRRVPLADVVNGDRLGQPPRDL